MGISFYKSTKIAPGIRLNFSKSGVSTSFGSKGCRVNFGKHGVRTTFSIPGTGIRYRSYSKYQYSESYNSTDYIKSQWENPYQWIACLFLLIWTFAFLSSLAQLSFQPLLYAFAFTIAWIAIAKLKKWIVNRIQENKEKKCSQSFRLSKEELAQMARENAIRKQRIESILAEIPLETKEDYKYIHPKFIEMVVIASVIEHGSTSFLQRRYGITYFEALKMIRYMQTLEIVSTEPEKSVYKTLIKAEDIPALLNSTYSSWVIANTSL